MPHEDLRAAGESLRAAADVAGDDLAGRLEEQAQEMETLAGRDPDHGRMARHESKLHDLAEEGGAEVAERVDEALAHIHAYRETVEGV